MNIEAHYREIAPKLTNYLVANGMDYSAACDIVQETFLRIWKMRDDVVDEPGQVSGLAYTIARNLRTSKFRKDSRMTFQDEIKDEDDTRLDGGVQATLPSDNEYLRRRILEALSRLPPLLKEAYTLFQISEKSIAEIAQLTGVTENLVKVRIHRAKMQLRTLLKDLK